MRSKYAVNFIQKRYNLFTEIIYSAFTFKVKNE